MKKGYAETKLGQVHYSRGGNGPPLLLLHPGPRSSRYYWRLAPLLAEHFEVFAPDTLGFGNSDPAPLDVTLPGLAENMVDFLDFFGVERAHVFGIHTGNKIATAMGAWFPTRVNKMILCGMTHSLMLETQRRNSEINKIVGHFTDAPQQGDESRLLLDWSAGFRMLSEEWWRMDLLGRFELGPDRFVQMEQRVTDVLQCRASMAASRRAILTFDLAEELRRITIPTLVIELASVTEAHLGLQGPKLVELLAQGSLMTINGADRDLLEFEPERFAVAIERYLNN